MKSTTPPRIRVRRFITDRYAYRAQPNYLSELVAFGIIVLTAFWPFFSWPAQWSADINSGRTKRILSAYLLSFIIWCCESSIIRRLRSLSTLASCDLFL